MGEHLRRLRKLERQMRHAVSGPAAMPPVWESVITALQGVADEPNSALAHLKLSAALAALAMAPPMRPSNGGMHAGFTEGPSGRLQDVRATAFAIAQLTATLERFSPEELAAHGRRPAELIALRGSLHRGVCSFRSAAEDLRVAAELSAGVDPDYEQSVRTAHSVVLSDIEVDDDIRSTEFEFDDEFRGVIQTIGEGVVNTFSFAPVDIVELGERPPGVELTPDVEPLLQEAAAIDGVSLAGWLEDRTTTEIVGSTVLIAGFLAYDHSFSLALCANERISTVDLTSRLSDGRVVETSLSRGSSWYIKGPQVVDYAVDPMPLADLVRVHRAVLAATVATSGAQIVPIRTAEEIGAAQEQLRQRVCEFRLREGFTATAVNGVGAEWVRYFTDEIQQVSRETIAAVAGGAQAPRRHAA